MIESAAKNIFVCIYEPRTKEVFSACTSQNPEYDLEVSAKIIYARLPTSKSNQHANFQIVVGMKNPLEYVAIRCDLSTQHWVLLCVKNGEESVEAEMSDSEIRPNIFFNLLIQVRGCSVSLDINGLPIFTAVRVVHGEPLSGLVGLIAKV